MITQIKRRKWLRHQVVNCLFLGLVSAICLGVLDRTGFFQNLELRAFDTLLQLRPDTAIDNRIVVINETEDDIRRFGHPLSDRILARALQAMENAGPRVVGIDKYRDIAVAPGTGDLDAVMHQYHNLVWIFFVGDARHDFIASPAALAKESERLGFNDVLQDADGVTRRGLLFLDVDNTSFYAFPLVLALHYLAADNIGAKADPQGYLSLNGMSLPPIDRRFGGYRNIDTRGYQIILDYPGFPEHFLTFTLADLLDGKIESNLLRDKIVLLGSSAASQNDYRLFPGEIRRLGIEYHAYLTSQLLNAAIKHKTTLSGWDDYGEYAWLLFWCMAGSLVGLYRVSLKYLLAVIAGECLLLLFCDYIFFNIGWWIPVMTPLFAWAGALGLSVLYFFSRARAERQQIMHLFACHVSPEVASKLWEAREQFLSDGKVRPDLLTATVLFTDLSNFTTVAESMDPLVLMDWLNQYMDEMSKIVTEHGGIINKYIGDAIMAIFGVPVKHDTENAIADDARNAVLCALAFNSRLIELNKRWQAEGLPTITMRTGIYTGSLVAGSFGGGGRVEYTVIGDTVNTASRLESFDKTISPPNAEKPCRILIGESTFNYISDFCQTKIVGACQLKGKNKSINIYEMLGRV